jgi:hypothetical protein
LLSVLYAFSKLKKFGNASFHIWCFKIFKSNSLWNSRPLHAIWWNQSPTNKYAYLLVDLYRFTNVLTSIISSLIMAIVFPTIDFYRSLHLFCLWLWASFLVASTSERACIPQPSHGLLTLCIAYQKLNLIIWFPWQTLTHKDNLNLKCTILWSCNNLLIFL